jgi:histidyl-tRNA synthetase
MAIGPPTGMRDWLPQDALLRQQLMETISSVYRLYGYLPIDTPVMEDLAVLLGKGGGENEKLLFKILKRGEKLAQAKDDELADYGLRYDLTVPLARFIATHQGKIPKIFRRYHIGPVWRADRPQKGRFREFYQCDIDVVGGVTFIYEVEIITATERVLKELNLGPYRFRLSDKRLLPLLLEGCGVSKEHIGPITIVLDKLDKLSLGEVCGEIRKILSANPSISKKVETFVREADPIRKAASGPAPYPFDKILRDLKHANVYPHLENVCNNIMVINGAVHEINRQSGVVPDPILVRGMDYYTGPIFEAVVEGYPSAILGGGRYDDLIGKFAGKKIHAVGCSIGFERILAILQEREASHTVVAVSRILLINDGENPARLQQHAEQLRNEGLCIETYLDRDDVGKQFKYAEAAGITWAIKRFDAVSSSVTVRYLPERSDLTLSLSEFKARLGVKNKV